MFGIAQIIELYYDHIEPFMETIANITFKAIESDEEEVKKAAIEVWSTIGDEEIIKTEF